MYIGKCIQTTVFSAECRLLAALSYTLYVLKACTQCAVSCDLIFYF